MRHFICSQRSGKNKYCLSIALKQMITKYFLSSILQPYYILLAGMTAGLLYCGGGVDLQEVETCTSLVLVGPGR